MAQLAEAGPVSSGRQRAVLWGALGTVVLLVGGALLVNTVLPGAHPVRAGEEIVLEQDANHRITMSFSEAGWVRDLDSEKVASDSQVFLRGPLELQVMPVTLAGGATVDADRLWKGLGDILRTEDSGVRLAAPAPITSDQGVEGLTGPVRGGERESVAVLYPSPDRDAAVHVLVAASSGSADLEEAVRATRSVVFSSEGGGA